MDYFFDIPVYRLTREKYDADQKAYIEKNLAGSNFQGSTATTWETHFWQKYGGAWVFNEIIGFIRLHFLGSQIRGEWWRVGGKRIMRSRTRRFEFRDVKVVYEEAIPTAGTSQQIYEAILAYLKRAQEDKYLKRFHVDTSVFERIGPYVDWITAHKALNFFSPDKQKKE